MADHLKQQPEQNDAQKNAEAFCKLKAALGQSCSAQEALANQIPPRAKDRLTAYNDAQLAKLEAAMKGQSSVQQETQEPEQTPEQIQNAYQASLLANGPAKRPTQTPSQQSQQTPLETRLTAPKDINSLFGTALTDCLVKMKQPGIQQYLDSAVVQCKIALPSGVTHSQFSAVESSLGGRRDDVIKCALKIFYAENRDVFVKKFPMIKV